MRRMALNAVLAGLLLLVLALPGRGFAWDHGGHGHWHGGGHGHWHGTSVVVGVGPVLGWGWGYPGYWYYPPAPAYYGYGYYPYPPAYGPAPVTRDDSQVYVERPAPPQDYWYYCESKHGYYPRVPSCPEPWTKVPAEPGR